MLFVFDPETQYLMNVLRKKIWYSSYISKAVFLDIFCEFVLCLQRRYYYCFLSLAQNETRQIVICLQWLICANSFVGVGIGNIIFLQSSINVPILISKSKYTLPLLQYINSRASPYTHGNTHSHFFKYFSKCCIE